MNRSHENLPVTISADWHSPIISATIYLRVARRGSIIADVIPLGEFHSLQCQALADSRVARCRGCGVLHELDS